VKGLKTKEGKYSARCQKRQISMNSRYLDQFDKTIAITTAPSMKSLWFTLLNLIFTLAYLSG